MWKAWPVTSGNSASSEDESSTDDVLKAPSDRLIPCLGRGLPPPQLCDFAIPKIAFVEPQVVFAVLLLLRNWLSYYVFFYVIQSSLYSAHHHNGDQAARWLRILCSLNLCSLISGFDENCSWHHFTASQRVLRCALLAVSSINNV